MVLHLRRRRAWAGASPPSLAFTTILALVLLPISAYVLWRTPFGLRLRSIGEKPSAADSLGVAVYRMKYIGVTISGALAGLGGAWLAIDIRAYNQDQVGRPRLPGPGRADLRQLAAGRHRRRRRAVRVRPVAHPAHRHRAGAGAVPPRRARRRRRRPSRCSPGARVPQAIGALIMGGAGVRSTTSSTEDGEQPDRLHHARTWSTLLVLAFASQHLRPPAAEGKPWRKGDIT